MSTQSTVLEGYHFCGGFLYGISPYTELRYFFKVTEANIRSFILPS